MRPICMGPELALPAMYATTLAREAASNREELHTNIAPSGLAAEASDVPLAIGVTPVASALFPIAPAEVG